MAIATAKIRAQRSSIRVAMDRLLSRSIKLNSLPERNLVNKDRPRTTRAHCFAHHRQLSAHFSDNWPELARLLTTRKKSITITKRANGIQYDKNNG